MAEENTRMGDPERNEISIHEVKVYLALRSRRDQWMSNGEIAHLLDGVAPRTVRAHTSKLVQAGIIDQAEVFPAHRYRWSDKAERRNTGYALRLQRAAEVFGLGAVSV